MDNKTIYLFASPLITACSAWMLFLVSNWVSAHRDRHVRLTEKLESLHLHLQDTATALDISRFTDEQINSPSILIQMHNDLLIRFNRAKAIMLLYFDDEAGLLNTLGPKIQELGHKCHEASTGQASVQAVSDLINPVVAQIYTFQNFLLEHRNDMTQKHWWKKYLEKIR